MCLDCAVNIQAPAIITMIKKNLYTSSHSTKSTSTRQNGGHFIDDIFKWIFMNEKFCILIQISPKFVPKGPVDKKTAQAMTWRRTGDKPLPEPVLPSSVTHICGNRGRLVKNNIVFVISKSEHSTLIVLASRVLSRRSAGNNMLVCPQKQCNMQPSTRYD